MESVTELEHLTAPAGKPQPLAFLGDTLYVGAWETDSIYAIDPETGAVRGTIAAPGKPYGLAVLNGTIYAVLAVGEADDRYLYKFSPAHGFDESSKVALPDLSGSHLASDGEQLYLLQMGKRQIVTLDGNGAMKREIPSKTRFAGITIASGALYGIAGDDELDNLYLAKIDASGAEASATGIAKVAESTRGLAHDGTNFWTSHRDDNEIISFKI